MGNCIAICKPNSNKSGSESAADEHRKVLQVVKTDGKILEFKSPITVKDFLVNFSGFSIAVSQILSKPLPPSYELKLGKTYHLLPPPPSPPTSTAEKTAQSNGVKRIKVVITKQQLQELLSKQRSIEDVLLSGLERKSSSSSVDSASTCWKPKLESIPEGSESCLT
ncbi:uncharacterized protein At1g66480-like [Camellia sinensis]|uniref:Uncharacterized protein n=2 Tax=Camellia sinensis TaxID=4442 RepID=A0A4S4EEN2_CAMSN|nr:uncharacterized protein At1g66480-like [Camellia sinensis]THG14851.1 hypothetical protein TEA_010418 [Camellia sinensis var. sinensis]THG20964.1 hypothetical protein TEA_029840 [Camellia sinensis var. sinensis]